MKIVKGKEPHYTFVAHEQDRELMLIGKGRGAYLWIGPVDGENGHKEIFVFGGQQSLRALARAILKNVPARAPRATP